MDLDDDQVPKKKIIEIKERRIFINNMNSYIPYYLIEQIRSNIKNKYTGTVTNNNNLPKNFKPNIIKIDPQSTYDNSELFDNNYFICCLDDSKYSDIEYIIKGLKSKDLEEEKYLILVSNIMTWAITSPKIKKDGNNEIIDDMEDDNMEGDTNDKDKDKDDKAGTKDDEELEEDDVVNELFEDPDDIDKDNMDDKKQDQDMEGEPVRKFILILNFKL